MRLVLVAAAIAGIDAWRSGLRTRRRRSSDLRWRRWRSLARLHLGALLRLRGLPLLNLRLHLGALLGLGSLSLLCLGHLLLRPCLTLRALLCLSRRLPLLALLPASPRLLLTPLLHVGLRALGLGALSLRTFTDLTLPRLFTSRAINL